MNDLKHYQVWIHYTALTHSDEWYPTNAYYEVEAYNPTHAKQKAYKLFRQDEDNKVLRVFTKQRIEVKEMKKAFVKEISDNYIIVKCPYCDREIRYTRNHTDEGHYIQQCPCGDRFHYFVDREEVFKGE